MTEGIFVKFVVKLFLINNDGLFDSYTDLISQKLWTIQSNLGQNYIILNKISTQTLKIHSEMQGNSKECVSGSYFSPKRKMAVIKMVTVMKVSEFPLPASSLHAKQCIKD